MNFTHLNRLDDEHGPLIYIWTIGADVYVGKSKRLGEAVRAGEPITLELIPGTLVGLNADEQRLIRELGATLNG